VRIQAMLDRIVRSRLFWIAWFALLGWLAR
jgi:hypothetical protein